MAIHRRYSGRGILAFSREDGISVFYGAIKSICLDGLAKSRSLAFRSWFDTSPRTENEMVTAHNVRSP
jgi:hypothetical protein